MKHRPFLTDQFFAFFALWQIVGVGTYIIDSLFPVYLVGMLVLTVTTALDFKSLLKPQQIRGHFLGPDSLILAEKFSFQLVIEFIQKMPFRPKRIFWHSPQLDSISFQNNRSKIEKKKEGPNKVKFSGQHLGKALKLGFFKINNAQLVSLSGLGFWTNELEIKFKNYEMRIYPPSGKMSPGDFLDRVSNQQIFLQGIRQSAIGRSSDQFYSVRKYQYPDSKRHIDPKKTAKYNELMTRIYEEHRSHHLVLALDCSRILMGNIGGSEKIDYYLAACLKLSEQAFKNGDEVSFIAFSDHIHYLVRGAKSTKELYELYRGSPLVRPSWNEPLYQLLSVTVNRVSKKRAIVFVMTDPSMPVVQKNLAKHLLPLCSRHLALVVGLCEKERLLKPFVEGLDDSELSLQNYSRLIYNIELENNLKLMQSQLSARGAGVVQTQSSELLDITRKSYDYLKASLYL